MFHSSLINRIQWVQYCIAALSLYLPNQCHTSTTTDVNWSNMPCRDIQLTRFFFPLFCSKSLSTSIWSHKQLVNTKHAATKHWINICICILIQIISLRSSWNYRSRDSEKYGNNLPNPHHLVVGRGGRTKKRHRRPLNINENQSCTIKWPFGWPRKIVNSKFGKRLKYLTLGVVLPSVKSGVPLCFG